MTLEKIIREETLSKLQSSKETVAAEEVQQNESVTDCHESSKKENNNDT